MKQTRAVLMFLFIIFLLPMAGLSQSNRSEPASKERVRAEQLWEQLVKARGGREKLHSIRNMMLTKGNNFPNVQMNFYVYPNRYWLWSKGKIVYEYTDVHMTNLDLGVYLSDPRPVNLEKLQPVNGGLNYRESWLIEACAFLLETRWLKPTPVRVTRRTVGKERLDVIETKFSDLTVYKDWGIDFYVEPESLIVRGAAFFSADSGRTYTNYIFGDYTSVEGILVPKAFGASLGMGSVKKSSFVPLSFRFNVGYDEKVFERPPSVAAGPDAWKPN